MAPSVMQTLHAFNPDTLLAPSAPTVVFAHANGYPPGSYRALLQPLAQSCRLFTIEHRPLWQGGAAPRTLRWSHYASDLIETLEREAEGPVWLAGHSMGAVTGLLAALRRPDLFSGLMALDPVLIPFNVWLIGQFMSHVLRGDIPIARVAIGRPHHFQGYEAAFQFYRSKRPFRRIADDVLWDYVHAGHEVVPGHGVQLSWSGAWEACVYRSAPYLMYRLGELTLPVLGIAGRDSDVLTEAALARWSSVAPATELEVLPGGHLIPLEAPEACADKMLTFMRTHGALTD